jgi:effector-binding domain-containing protein
MIPEIALKQQGYQPIMSIRTVTRMEDLPKLIGEKFMQIDRYLKDLGVENSGAPFVAYYNLDMAKLDVEIGFPVEDILPGEGEMCPGELPEGPWVTTLYEGPYEGMKVAYEAMMAWMAENGWEVAGPYYEMYLNSPDEVKPEKLMTRIDLVVKKAEEESHGMFRND